MKNAFGNKNSKPSRLKISLGTWMERHIIAILKPVLKPC
jgi:uncharacterized protein YueI